MDKNTKYLLLAGVAGLGLWWWFSQGQAHAQMADHIPATPLPLLPTASAGPGEAVVTATPVTTSQGTIAVSMSQAPAITQAMMVQALMMWAEQTKNPALYEQMISQASASDIAGLYNLLTTYWAGTTATPTAAQTTFWNALRQEYPFLNTGGVNCNNFACN